MPAGIQVWDEQGRLVVDTTSRFLKSTTIQIGEVTQPGSVDVSPLLSAGATITPVVQNLDDLAPPPEVAVSEGRLHWFKQNGNVPNFRAEIRVSLL